MTTKLPIVHESTALLHEELDTSSSTNSSTEYLTLDHKKPAKINKWEVIPSLWCGAFLAALDSTIVTAIYPLIGADFHKSDQASWVATAYMLSSSAMQPLYGGLSDIFGRKTMLLVANIIFLIGSFGCFLSKTMTQLLIARVIAGIGGAGLGTLSSIIVSDIVTLKQRSTYNGFANLIYGCGQVVGGPLGGYLADLLGWRFAFLIQCPITLVSVIIIYMRVKLPVTKHKVTIRDIDFLGSIFLMSAVVLILIALELLTSSGIHSFKSISAVLAGLFCFCMVFIIESRVQYPIISLKVLLSRNPLLSGLTNFFGYMGFFALTFNLPLLLQVVHGESASESGSRLILSIVAMCTGSLTAGYITRKTGNYYWVCLVGVTSEICGSLLSTTFSQHTKGWKFQAYIIPSGLGHGLVLSSTLMAIISSVKKQDQAKAISMSYLFRVLGSAFGVTVTSLFNNFLLSLRLSESLKDVPGNQDIISRITKSVAEINNLPESIKKIVKSQFSLVIHRSFDLVVFIEIISFSFAVCLKQFSLDRDD